MTTMYGLAMRATAATIGFLLASGHALGTTDLRNATVERLDNGLTVILLEDRNFPVVSTQMLYRVGARDESFGQTGIAHFLEHMAFRGSTDFPDTGLVSSIYAVGGEWHGYTWTDQTTYFATVPDEHADLLLRIEADRMSRLDVSQDDMEAERGAVLAEMHMYENYPTSMLLDAVMFTSFQAHPYRNNTIGWESDIEGLRHDEVVAFYERHYQPANAVLAVVGDFDRAEMRARIIELFGDIEGGKPTPLPRTAEPEQQGERHVRLYGNTDNKRFMTAWRAPSANDTDFAAFLVLQEVLGAGSGVNFRQNDWGTPVGENSRLHGAAENMTTWYPPSAQDYVFVIGGTVAGDADEAAVEREIERRLAAVRDMPVQQDELAAAIDDVREQLVYDVATTEDAAQQLAFFDGLRALDVLLELPGRVAAVSAEDVQRVARTYLTPAKRTTGWYLPDERPPVSRSPAPAVESTVPASVASPAPIDVTPLPEPTVSKLPGGIPVIIQPSDTSPSAYLQIVVRGTEFESLTPHSPVHGYSSLTSRFRPGDLRAELGKAREEFDSALTTPASDRGLSPDPQTRLEQTIRQMIDGRSAGDDAPPGPALIVASGDFDTPQMLQALSRHFGDLEAAVERVPSAGSAVVEDVDVRLSAPVAQAQLGYLVPAPAPASDEALAWRLLLYTLSHDYEGRLGKEAISRRGLAYFIDSRYRSDGHHGWITLTVGVDPDKLAPLRDLLYAELQRLQDEPPSASELAEAKQHFLGRARSAAQSNAELSSMLGEQWLWYGEVRTPDRLQQALAGVGRDDILRIVGAFGDGATITVDR